MPAPAERLTHLREELRARRLDGFLAPRTDAFMGEYMPACAERVQWLTGFAGSAGFVGVAMESAAIFVDGRYTLQVRDQVDVEAFVPRSIADEPPTAWIAESFEAGARIGYDPWLHTRAGLKRLADAAAEIGAELIALDDNPIDAVWTNRPAFPDAPVHAHGLEFAGESSEDKRLRLGADLARRNIDAAVVTASDSVAWLLNIRGADVPNCPLALSYVILASDGTVDWFIDPAKVDETVREALGDAVAIRPLAEFAGALEALGTDGARIQADPTGSPVAVFDRLMAGGAEIAERADPCLLPKARKNEIEVEGARIAHRRDGAALAAFLHWLDETAPGGTITELDAIEKLHDLRTRGERFHGPSFDTIAGYGGNGAIVHYRASEETNRRIEPGSLLLVDSGGQYDEGTTDVTRTIAIGMPSDEMSKRFTQVLKGHIAIATARFPTGVTGSQLDPFARAALWADGVDYDHGTGHGVGSFLNVHEGPQRISKGHSTTALEMGMIVSNEPGYYKTDGFGIRIENLVVVYPVIDIPADAEKDLLGFETLTLAPIDRRLIDPALLSAAERQWLDDYHARVLEEIRPMVEDPVRDWLERACAPLDA
ncbi:aminopeptidase P family protein [Marivibrio halodurans]|uniref:Aminopeptidase P family protein n=2 Tax=Marivibrio halodurans TaxID=2039722 RepID=A0A8J7SMM8_9PROT|nr:aminopeptidase P family protein [Marivibrio halodurans]